MVLKRSLDIVCSLAALVSSCRRCSWPRHRDTGSTRGVRFCFGRRGWGGTGVTFRILKFRTMVVDADARKHEVAHLNKHLDDGDDRMFKVPDDPRVTRVGRFLRRTSIDELPQLWNVLVGPDEPCRPSAPHPRRARPCRRLGAEAPRAQAGHHGPVAGARTRRHPVQRDGRARLPVRHRVVAVERPEADVPDAPGARPSIGRQDEHRRSSGRRSHRPPRRTSSVCAATRGRSRAQWPCVVDRVMSGSSVAMRSSATSTS